jgi:endonuclease YncB( thermonuclease family)
MEPNYTYNAKVVRVVDGDTIDVMIAQGQEGGVNIVIQTRIDPAHRYDSFRRYLAKVWLPGSDEELGTYLLINGHAVQWHKGGVK